MSLPALHGHSVVWQRLCAALASGRLSHALLFTGPPGVGKSLTARLLAARVACAGSGQTPCGECPGCRQVTAGSHPDFRLIGLGAGKKEIGVDQSRQLKRFVHMHAVVAPRKMAIIEDADRLSIAAQNALLKSLEEPPGQALIILVTASPGALLSTVRSRCQRVVFQPLTRDQVCAVLQQNGIDAEQAEALATAAEGSPGRALVLRESWHGRQREELLALLAALDPTRYVSVVEMSKMLGRTEQEMTVRLQGVMAAYHDAAARAAASAAGSQALASSSMGVRVTDVEVAIRGAEAVADALQTLRRRNPNRPLLAEALALRLARN